MIQIKIEYWEKFDLDLNAGQLKLEFGAPPSNSDPVGWAYFDGQVDIDFFGFLPKGKCFKPFV